MKNNVMTLKWRNVKEEMPDKFKAVFVAYIDEDGSNQGIAIAAYQGGGWSFDPPLIGEMADDDESIVTHWADFQSEMLYPEEYTEASE